MMIWRLNEGNLSSKIEKSRFRGIGAVGIDLNGKDE